VIPDVVVTGEQLERGKGKEMPSALLAEIVKGIVDGETDLVVERVRRALDSGIEPMAVIDDGLLPGLRIVGDKYSCGEYFLPHLITSAAAMKQAMHLLGPELAARRQTRQKGGTVVIGTVRGDIHEIGKSLVATMLSAHGFEVHDLGVDVPTERFVSAVKDTGANLVGLSALLTTTMGVQRDVIEALDAAGLRNSVKVMVGGAPVDRHWADRIGADGYSEDAIGAVRLATELSRA
jgi:corrinoid protein of di/trimethylamine methyltransferase